MRPAVISAWQHDVAASVAACSESTPPLTDRKRSRPYEARAAPNQRSQKRPRVALSTIDANPRSMSAHTKGRSPSKRTRAPSPRKRGNHVPDDAEKEPEIAHPRPHPPIHHFDPPSSYPEALATDYHESEVSRRSSPSRRARTESDAPSTPKRSASPVKRVAALQDVGSGIFYQELSDNGAELGTEGQQLFWSLQDSSLGIAALPSALEPELLPELGRNRPFQMDTTDSRSREELLTELESVREINRASRRCVKESESEPEWNSSVHGRLLHLALKNEDRAGFRYMYVHSLWKTGSATELFLVLQLGSIPNTYLRTRLVLLCRQRWLIMQYISKQTGLLLLILLLPALFKRRSRPSSPT